jgi:hypothetical protein
MERAARDLAEERTRAALADAACGAYEAAYAQGGELSAREATALV